MITNLLILAVLGFLIYAMITKSSGYADYMGSPSDESLAESSESQEEPTAPETDSGGESPLEEESEQNEAG